MGQKGWNVYRTKDSLEPMDTVFYDANCSAEYVWRGLIEHDGYPSTIVVECGDEQYPIED